MMSLLSILISLLMSCGVLARLHGNISVHLPKYSGLSQCSWNRPDGCTTCESRQQVEVVRQPIVVAQAANLSKRDPKLSALLFNVPPVS